MKTLWLPLVIFFLNPHLTAQEDVIDPSIFDGSGKKTESVTPEESSTKPSASEKTDAEDAEEEGSDETSEAPVLPEINPEETISEEEAPKEEETVDSESDDQEEGATESPPGVPASVGTGESRAGQTVKSTEKIAPGQAVDYPWDM